MMHPIENYLILPFKTLHIRGFYLPLVLGIGKAMRCSTWGAWIQIEAVGAVNP